MDEVKLRQQKEAEVENLNGALEDLQRQKARRELPSRAPFPSGAKAPGGGPHATLCGS